MHVLLGTVAVISSMLSAFYSAERKVLHQLAVAAGIIVFNPAVGLAQVIAPPPSPAEETVEVRPPAVESVVPDDNPKVPAEQLQQVPSSCIVATVTVGPKPNWGDKWDFPGKAPDVDIREIITGSANYCQDSYECQVRVDVAPETLSFSIVDDDNLSANDRIGSGECAPSGLCSLPPAATIEIAPC